MLHQLADEKKLGWVENYLEVLEDYLKIGEKNDGDN